MKPNHRLLNTPWATSNDLYSAPGSLIVKLSLGEAPHAIPSTLEVRRHHQAPALSMSVGSVDRVFNHLAEQVRITRVHTPAAELGKPRVQANKSQGFNAIEHVIGLSRTFRIEAGRDASITHIVDALRQLAVVEEAYPNYMTLLPFAMPSPPRRDQSDEGWAARAIINADAALGYETGDPAVIVAIVDTGVAQQHPELRARLRAGVDTVQLGVGQMASGVRLVGDRQRIDTDPEDTVGHGTACAAIIGASGEQLPPGLAGDCSLMAARVLGGAVFPGKEVPVGIGALTDIDLGMKNIIDLGAKVINMSFGTPVGMLDSNDPLPHEDVIRYGLMRGCIMVAASGNSGQTERFSPACLEGVIAVGAVTDEGRPTAFTTRGAHVAFCAPGERVLSAGLEGYQQVTGTSFAAPFAAAAAALLVSRAARRSHALDASDVRRLLSETTTPFESDRPDGCGSGVMDAFAALRALDHEIDQVRQHERLTGDSDDG